MKTIVNCDPKVRDIVGQGDLFAVAADAQEGDLFTTAADVQDGYIVMSHEQGARALRHSPRRSGLYGLSLQAGDVQHFPANLPIVRLRVVGGTLKLERDE